MPKFRFSVIESNHGEIVVEADNYDEALKLAHQKYQDDDVLWGDGEMTVNLEESGK